MYFQSIYFVGGFSASPYLKTQLLQRLPHLSINTPDGQTCVCFIFFVLVNYELLIMTKGEGRSRWRYTLLH